ncbi:MAG: sulfatase-like hydrolase/transferase, partial [Planctomycetes bacterium]|nr:sulfatase-like hydrolase/transferase [Planctomycetota bacterium]
MKRLIGTVLTLLLLSAAGFAGEPAQRPPNVVLILADDLGYADLGAQGCRDIPTPAIDSIATAGIRFTNAYVPCPVCAPTRAGLLTGRYPQRFGFEHNPGNERNASPDFGIPAAEPILAERLKAAGYATGMVGKWHVGYRRELQPPSRGFDSFFGFLSGANDYFAKGRSGRSPILRGFEPVEEKEYLTDAFAREAVAFIDAHRGQPFFLYMPFNAVHAPLEAPDEMRARFPEIADPKRLTHAAMLAAMDDAVGLILGALRRHGIEENTLVIFLSDIGGPTPQTTSRNDPLRGFKGQVYEGGVRVPFFIQWKGGLEAGKVESRPVIALDLLPTVQAAAGVPLQGGPPPDGVDLLPYIRGEKEGRPHEALFWRMGRQSAVRLGDLKLVVRDGVAELYDLAKDVGEARDLSRERPEDVARLRKALADWEEGTVPARWYRNEEAPEGPATGRSRPGARGDVEARFRTLDADGDGKVSRAEGASIGRLFDRLDADRDGFVTLEETRRAAAREGVPENTPPPSPREESGRRVEGVTIELAARDPGAVLRFYRDGLGMKEVGEGLLEMAGTRLRIVKAAAPEATPAAEGSAFRRALSALGFRYLSLWLADPEAAVRRIEAAGFPRPRAGANVWLGEDPGGNLVEIMNVPRDIPGEAVTVAILVTDEAAARRFYGETLGLPLLATW